MPKPHSKFRRHPLVRYIYEFSDLKRPLLLGNFFAIVQSLSLIPISLLFKRIVDTYIPRQDAAAIAWVIAAGFALWTLHVVSTVTSRYYTLYATKHVTERLRARLVMKLQQMSLRFYDNEKVGDLHARVILDTERVDVMANSMVVHLLTSAVIALSASALLIMLNARLFLLIALLIPFYFIIRSAFADKLKHGHGHFRKDMERMSSIVSDVLHSIRLVKSFAREDFEQKRVEEQVRQVTDRGVRLFTEAALFNILLTCVGGMATLSIFTVGGWMVISGQLSLGEVVAFATLMAYFLTPINTLISSTDTLYSGMAGLESVYSLEDVFDTEQSEHLPRIEVKGEVRFEEVRFEYQQEHPVLDSIHLTARPGEQIALVGSSGAGKTTLVNLILGFYMPTHGRVLIDGHNVSQVNLRTLREQIGVVSQDNVLIGGTIFNNIHYGRLKATREEVIEAARLANAEEFILRLPDGYDTEIGDRGIRLSGGQRQRLAIARAILKNPRILILDEATSALDSESERAVQQALDQLRRDRTSFIIAHRLSTIQNADLILVMRHGRIVERGTFEELLCARGEFHRYYRLQFAKEADAVA